MKRCCFCLPLRRGLLTFGYVYLAVSVALLLSEVILCLFLIGFYGSADTTSFCVFRGVALEVHIGAVIALYSMEVAFAVLFIIALHKKMTKPLQVCFYYQILAITFSIILLLTLCVSGHKQWGYVPTYMTSDRLDWVAVLIELSVIVLVFLLQSYVLLLLRGQIVKQNYQEESYVIFVNRETDVPNIEADCS